MMHNDNLYDSKHFKERKSLQLNQTRENPIEFQKHRFTTNAGGVCSNRYLL